MFEGQGCMVPPTDYIILGKVESVPQSSDDSWIEFWVHRLVHGQHRWLIPAEISQDGEQMYTHSWFMLMYGKNHYNIVK